MRINAVPPAAAETLRGLITAHGLAHVLEAVAQITQARDNIHAHRAAGAIQQAANTVTDILHDI